MKKIARFLRKLADLFDPRVNPSDELMIRVSVDTEQALKDINELIKKSERLAEVTGHA